MKFLNSVGLALALSIGSFSALAAEGKVSQTRLDSVMAAWPADVRANAEQLVSRFGLPDRVTATTLVWDVPDTAQQNAMVRAVGEARATAEAGEETPAR